MAHATTPQTALITGASRGLGEALARRLSADGWELILDARGESDLQAVADSLSGPVTAIAGDITDPRHRRQLVEAVRTVGGLDAIINNAGVLGPSPQSGLVAYPLDTLEQVLRINTVAPLAIIQSLASHLRDGARIINITSDAAVEGYEGWGGYGASKAALEQISNVLAAEHPDWRVYRVDPGDMNTRMHQEAFPGLDISDRPDPEASVPGIVELLSAEHASGRYRARELSPTLTREVA